MKNYKFPTVEELLEAGVHFGHSVNKWNPRMEPYIYTAKQGVHILDLDQTQELLKEAGEFLFDVASKGGQVIFVATKKQIAQICAVEAKRCGAMYMSERWVGGTITNYKIIKKSIDKLAGLKKKRDAGELAMYTKKERLLIDREIAKLEKYFGGVGDLKGEPQAVFVVDAKRERTAINECRIFDVPVVALIDTNSDPTDVLKVIPGNDDAAKSVTKIVKVLADCVEEGYKEFQSKKEKGSKEVKVDIKVAGSVEKAKEEVSAEVAQQTESEAIRTTEEPDKSEKEAEKAKPKKIKVKKEKAEVKKTKSKKVAQVKKSIKKTKEDK
jgi:small subunit ribosomal protein S2